MGDIFTLSPDVDTNVSPLYQRKVRGRNARAAMKQTDDLDSASALILAGQANTAPSTAPQASPAPSSSKPEYMADMGKGAVGGIRDAIQETADTLTSLSRGIGTRFFNLLKEAPGAKDYAKGEVKRLEGAKLPELVDVEKQQTLPGQLTRGVSQFLTGFLPVNKAVQGVNLTSKVFRSAKVASAIKGGAAGVITDAVAFDPLEKRASNFINEVGTEYGVDLSNPVTDFLAAKPDDSEALGRFKNALEGLAIGGAVESVFRLVKARRAMPSSVKDAFDEKLGDVLKDLGDDATAAKGGAFTDLTYPSAVRQAEQQDVFQRVKEMENLQTAIDEASAAAKAEDLRLQQYREGKPDIDFELVGKPYGASPYKTDFITIGKPYDGVKPSEFELVGKPYSSTAVEGDIGIKGRLDDAVDLSYLKQAENSNLVDNLLVAGADHPKPRIDVVGDYKPKSIEVDTPTAKGKASVDNPEASEALAKAAKEREQGLGIIQYVHDLGHPSVDSWISSLRNNTGFAAHDVMGATATGGAGALVGGKKDLNDDGKVDIQDVALGFMMGVGLYSGGKFLVGKMSKEGKGVDEAFKDLKSDKLAQVDTVITKLNTAIGSGTLDPATLKRYQQHLETMGELKKSLQGIKSHNTVTKAIRDEAVAVKYKNSIKPIVTFSEDSAKMNNLVDAIRNGDEIAITEGLDVNFKYMDGVDADDQLKTIFNQVSEKLGTGKTDERSWATAKQYADDIGMTEKSLETLNKTFNNTAHLDSKIHTGNALLLKSGNDIKQLAEELKALTSDVNISEMAKAEKVLELRKQLVIHAGIQREMRGVRTEVGRALNIFKDMTKALENGKELEGIIADLGGIDKNLVVAEKVLKLINDGDKRGLNQYARAIDNNPKLNAVFEYWYNSLLSSPSTWTVNLLTNAMTTTIMPVERMLAGSINMIKGGDGQQIRQAQAMFFGMTEGLKDAWRMAAKSFKEAAPQLDPYTKIDGIHTKAISADTLNVAPESTVGKAIDWLGTIVRIPTERILTSGDEFFKVINYRMALNEQLYLQAIKEGEAQGLADEALVHFASDRLNSLRQDLPADIIDAIKENAIDADIHQTALATARYNTFSTNLSPEMQGLNKFVNSHPFAKIIIPFLKVPTNILLYANERTPLALAWSKELRANLKHTDPAVREATQAKLAMGTMMYTTAYSMAASGMLTGNGAKDNTDKSIAGVPRYSIKLGDTWYTYNRLDPIGMFLGLAADAHDIIGRVGEDEGGDIAVACMSAMSKNLLSKTYLQGISKFVDTAFDPNPTNVQSYLGNLLGTLAPSGAFAIAKIADPNMRETHEYLDFIKKRIPGLSDNLPPVRNIFGEAVALAPGYGLDSMSPIYSTKESKDPVKQEFMRLGLTHKLKLDSLKKIGKDIKLSPEQHDVYVQMIGIPFKERLNKLIQTPRYQAASDNAVEGVDGGKASMIKEVFEQCKHRAQVQLFREYPEIRETLRHNKRMTREAKRASSDWLQQQVQQ